MWVGPKTDGMSERTSEGTKVEPQKQAWLTYTVTGWDGLVDRVDE